MSREDGPRTTAIVEDAPSASEDRSAVLPWIWPDGSRLMLASIAMVLAVGLMAGTGRSDRRRERRPVHAAQASAPGLDPSTATAEALAGLPRIGPTLARRIVEAQADGPFRSPEDLRARVHGIGPATLAQIEPYLRFEAGSQVRTGLSTIAIAEAEVPRPSRSRRRKPRGSSRRLAARAEVAAASP